MERRRLRPENILGPRGRVAARRPPPVVGGQRLRLGGNGSRAADGVRCRRRWLHAVPGAPRDGETFTPSRDLAARRAEYYGARGAAADDAAPVTDAARRRQRRVVPRRPIVPGERRYRDGDRVRHAAFGEGTVVTSKLTRDDEEVTVAFPERGVKKLLASLANLDLVG